MRYSEDPRRTTKNRHSSSISNWKPERPLTGCVFPYPSKQPQGLEYMTTIFATTSLGCLRAMRARKQRLRSGATATGHTASTSTKRTEIEQELEICEGPPKHDLGIKGQEFAAAEMTRHLGSCICILREVDLLPVQKTVRRAGMLVRAWVPEQNQQYGRAKQGLLVAGWKRDEVARALTDVCEHIQQHGFCHTATMLRYNARQAKREEEARRRAESREGRVR